MPLVSRVMAGPNILRNPIELRIPTYFFPRSLLGL